MNPTAGGFKIISRFFPFNKIDVPSREATGFKIKLTRATKQGLNTHRSNRAKNGLYHGKDIRNGNSISFSHMKSKRFFYPNVQQKRVWSDAMNDMIKFNMTTCAMKKIDHYGGVDNYLLALDDRQINDSNFVKKYRDLIASTMYYNGTLHLDIQKRLGYLKVPPKTVVELQEQERLANLKSKCVGTKRIQAKKIKPVDVADLVADLKV